MSGQSDATITIEGLYIDTGIELVDATSIRDFENIVYTNNENDVTANKTDYFTIVEDGDRRIIASKDDTDYAITIADGIENGTLTAAATAKYLETVTVTATPDFGYRLVCLVVKDAYDNDVALNDNTFLMPKGGVTVSAEFAQVYHGTTEFVLGYFAPDGYEKEATIYDGVTTVNLQSGISYSIGKDYYEFVHGEDHIGGTESSFLLDNNIDSVDIPYAGGTGEFVELLDTEFNLNSNSESGFYDITMTDAGNGKWSVSILKTVGVIDNIPDQTYTGSEITPEPLVMAGSLNLTKGTDYEYSYTNNTDAGTATVRATFKGNYASLGYVEKTFNIVYPDGIGAHLAGHSLSLTGNIGVNFYMELDDSVAANENAYMHFTLPNGKTQDVKIGQAEPKTISGKTYYVFQCNVAAKEMTDTIKAQMFSGGKSGQPYEYTVKEYADYLFANAYEDDGTTVKNQDYVDAIPLVKAMLNYGAYSQIYFGHHTEELANGGTDSTDIQNVDASTINKPYEPDYTYLGSTGDTTFEGATLSLRSETTLSLYFKSSRDLSFACYPYEVEKNTTAGGYQIARIRGIKAADLDETFGLVIDDAAETGTIRTFLGHVDYCPLTYCYNVLNGGSDDEDLQNVCKAMYLYWQAAKAYSE